MNVVRISDGLGNQMFQYAFARKLQIVTKGKVYLDTRFINNEDMFAIGEMQKFKGKLAYRQFGIDNFKIVLPIADEGLVKHWNYLKLDNWFHKMIFQFAKEKMWMWNYLREDLNMPEQLQKSVFSTYYQGYFFDLKYFDDIKPVLQSEFRLKKKMVLPNRLKAILANENTIGVHIRRGDFLRLSRDISNSDYYEKAFGVMCARVEKPVYLVFSDDINWVKENIEIPEKKIYVSDMGFRDYEELCIMKHCKHNIIANSTFSYWAAYLNQNSNKIIVCPKRWKPAIIPSEWIRL